MAGEERVTKLKIDNVKKIYQTRKGEMTALNGVNLDIKENEFICVVGPSGCGKSTLLNIIAGLDTPTSGAVYIDGKKIEGTGTERGVVFQQYALFPWLTVLKNVMFGLKLQGKSDAEAKEIAMKYIKMVQLEDFVNHYPKELSGSVAKYPSVVQTVLSVRSARNTKPMKTMPSDCPVLRQVLSYKYHKLPASCHSAYRHLPESPDSGSPSDTH